MAALGGLASLLLVYRWFGWSVDGLTGLWVVWLVCEWFVGGLAGLGVIWLVSGRFGWLVGGFEFYS